MTFTSYVHGGYQEIPVIVTHTIVCKATSTILYSMISPSHDYRITNRDKHEWEQRSCFVFDFELLWLFKKCIPKLRDSIVLVFSPVLKTIFYKKKTNPQQNKKNMLWVVGAISVLFKSHSHKNCVTDWKQIEPIKTEYSTSHKKLPHDHDQVGELNEKENKYI